MTDSFIFLGVPCGLRGFIVHLLRVFAKRLFKIASR